MEMGTNVRSKYLLVTFWCVFVFIIGESNCAKNVTIQKCCKFDEVLTSDNVCLRVENPQWTLRYYSAAKRAYLPKNIPVPPNWHLKAGSKPDCSKPQILQQDTGSYVAFENGSLFVLTYDTLLHPSEYCVDYESALLCKKDKIDQENVSPIKKCCGKDAIFSETHKRCRVFKGPGYEIALPDGKMWDKGFPNCEGSKVAIWGKLQKENFRENGSLWLSDRNALIPPTNYCIEHVLENSGGIPTVMLCKSHLLPPVVVQPVKNDLRFTLYPIGLALSSIFLAATLIAAYLLPASHHMLHWKCQRNHVFCLLVGDILLCITQLSGQMDYIPCILMAMAMHFFFLAAFFWLNTMCFNIWWTFRDLRPQSVEKSQERCRLRLYEIYAWGIPFLIGMIAVILDNVDGPGRPRFGENNCWFAGDIEKLTFFFGPIGVLLVVNVALFTLTARELTCGLWKRELVKSTTERAALSRVCIKLVIVMGVTWIIDVISWAVGGPQELWYVTDLMNTLQGVFIFIVIGCQPQVFAAVKRIWCLRKHGQNGTAATTNHHSSSSQGLPSMGETLTNSVTNNTTKSVPLETSC